MLCGAALPALAGKSDWPRVQPLTQRVEIDLTGASRDIRLPILLSDGHPGYWLRCLAGTTEQLDVKGDHDGENYVAPLACVLVQQPEGWSGSLLSEDESAIWFSRGQFSGNDLTGDCGRYPEFGRVRHFRLRGMQLTLSADNVVLDQGRLASLTLHVAVEDDPGARTTIAERAAYLPPRGYCHVVRRGSEPLMCRNKDTFSWQECTPPQKQDMGYPKANQP